MLRGGRLNFSSSVKDNILKEFDICFRLSFHFLPLNSVAKKDFFSYLSNLAKTIFSLITALINLSWSLPHKNQEDEPFHGPSTTKTKRANTFPVPPLQKPGGRTLSWSLHYKNQEYEHFPGPSTTKTRRTNT